MGKLKEHEEEFSILIFLWQQIIKKRDGYRCSWCGKQAEALHAHHIVTKSRGNNKSRFQLCNGMCLCVECHIYKINSDALGYKKFRNEYLQKRYKINYCDLKLRCTDVNDRIDYKWILMKMINYQLIIMGKAPKWKMK